MPEIGMIHLTGIEFKRILLQGSVEIKICFTQQSGSVVADGYDKSR